MNGISTAITKTLYFAMAAALFLTSSTTTAQVLGGSAQRADTTVSQPEVATEVILNWLDAIGGRVPNRTSSANYGRSS